MSYFKLNCILFIKLLYIFDYYCHEIYFKVTNIQIINLSIIPNIIFNFIIVFKYLSFLLSFGFKIYIINAQLSKLYNKYD